MFQDFDNQLILLKYFCGTFTVSLTHRVEQAREGTGPAMPAALQALFDSHVGTAALGCPVERSSTVFCCETGVAERCSAGQPRAAVPT
jgi:hypothetical protein